MAFGYYAILLSMLSYTAWHLGKPLPELWGTLVWGLVAGTIVLADPDDLGDRPRPLAA